MWIMSYLSNRKQFVTQDCAKSEECSVTFLDPYYS